MAKVVLWGFSSTGTDMQKEHLQQLQAIGNNIFSFQFGEAKLTSVLDDCIVLLNHDGINSHSLKSSIQWKIECSGSISVAKLNETNKTAGIPFSVLVENLRTFLVSVQNSNEITKEDIALLSAYDPDLEKYLQPFSSASPFKSTNADGVDLMTAKESLKSYVHEYLKR